MTGTFVTHNLISYIEDLKFFGYFLRQLRKKHYVKNEIIIFESIQPDLVLNDFI